MQFCLIAVKTLLMQNELGERLRKRMAILQEFNLEIKSMKLVLRKVLTKMIADNEIGNDKKNRFVDEINTDNQWKIIVSQVDIDQGITTDVWYQDIVYYLLQN